RPDLRHRRPVRQPPRRPVPGRRLGRVRHPEVAVDGPVLRLSRARLDDLGPVQLPGQPGDLERVAEVLTPAARRAATEGLIDDHLRVALDAVFVDCEYGVRTAPSPFRRASAFDFGVLSGLSRPSLLIPLGSAGAAAGSLASFPNRSPRVRLMKKLLAAALKMGIGRPLLDRVFVECAEPPPVSGLISTVTGEARPVFALLPGPPGPYRKVVVQAMRPGGETLGYLKIPLSPAAEERVRREERALRRLEEAPGLRTRVPRVLHAGPLRGSHVLFLSPGVGRSGPARWTPMHDEFFRILGGIRPARRDGPSLIAEVAERWRKAVGDDGEWSAIASRALKQAGEALSGIEVPCGVTHGDFSAE